MRGIQQLTRVNKDGSKVVRWRVQINRKTFKQDRLFDDYEEAVEFLQASKSHTGQDKINLLEERNKREMEIIADWFKNPSFSTYIKAYIKKYIEPKYQGIDFTTPEGKMKLRNYNSTQAFFRTIERTEINRRDEGNLISSAHGYIQYKGKTKFGDLKPVEITEIELNTYIQERLNKGIKPISVQRELQLISNVFKKIRHIDPNLKGLKNPCEDYDRDLLKAGGNIIKKHSFRLTEDDRQKLFVALKNYKNPELGWIVKLMLLTAMRRSEAVLLRWTQVHENYIYLEHTKSGRPRIVHLIPQAKELLNSIPKREQEDRVFKYTVLGFEGSYKKFRDEIGLSHIKPHALRKEAISNFIEEIGAGNSLLIAEFLGFANVNKLEDLIKTQHIATEINSQAALLRSIGHSSPTTTQNHYFSLKTDK